MLKDKGGITQLLLLSCLLSLPVYANDSPKVKPQSVINSMRATIAPAGLSPAQVQLAYGFSNLPFKGEGQTIAIVTAFDNPNAEADLGVFSTEFNLPTCTTANGCFQKLAASGGSLPPADTGWSVEAAAEIQWAHAMAPNAKIMLVEAADDSLTTMLNAVNFAMQRGATIINMGWGTPEFATETSLDSLFTANGVTFVAATGSTGNGTLYPAVVHQVIAVGGTSLTIDNRGNYLGEIAWSGSGGGVSAYEAQPTYQADLPIPNNPTAKRGIPDVSFNADPLRGYAVYNSAGTGGWITLGGTGIATAQMSALSAVIRSGTHKNVSLMNALLYRAAKTRYSLTYNSINSGSNGACGYYCTAQAGYNYVTGLGSPQAQYLAYEVIYNGFVA